MSTHTPVLYDPVLRLLKTRPNGKYIDATIGAGGHAAGLLGDSARVLGVDADPSALALAWQNLAGFGNRLVLAHSNFDRLEEVAREEEFFPSDGILLDLGVSSMELAEDTRGFSFRSMGNLDMRFNPVDSTRAVDLVNTLPERELADLIFRFGEERASRRIARAIVNSRPHTTAARLAQVIERAMPRRGRIHPATRTFQALRIAVNQELERLERVLPQTVTTLAPGGRVVVISYHSLEDRIVKKFFRSESRLQVLTKRPLVPSRDEIRLNPRSRSAKLRAAERVTL